MQVGSLGETHFAKAPGPAVHQCICTECSPGQGVEQLAVRGFWRGEQIYLSFAELSPNQLDHLGCSRHSPGSAARESSLATQLSTPGTWMARSDLRCFWLQRRWRASCDMRRERRPPLQLMFAMVAVLSVRTSTCLPCNGPFRRLRTRGTASNSRQLMCQCSWGPVHTPDTACPLYVVPHLRTQPWSQCWSSLMALFHCMVLYGSVRLSSGRFAFPPQFSTTIEWVGLFTRRYNCGASTAVTSS